MAIRKAKPKKIKVRARPRTGIAAAPLNTGFAKFQYYVHYELDKKASNYITKDYVKKNFSKADAKAILSNPEYNFYMYSLHIAAIFWTSQGLELPYKYSQSMEYINKFYKKLIETGKEILATKSEVTEENTKNVIVLTPRQRLYNKIQDTVMSDLDLLEDAWMDGEEPVFDMYATYKKYGLSSAHIAPVLNRLDGWLLDYEDAYHKRCDQAVEGYSHIKRPVLRRRIKFIETLKEDLDRIKATAKATRKPRVKKPKAADKQIVNLKYRKEDHEFKIASVLPILLIGAMRIYVFNVKTKELTEYVTDSTKGFEVKGTTLQNVGSDSRKTRLRKPTEVLPIIQAKTIRQIDNTWNSLTTKTNSPNGRLNSDCVLLRVSDR